MDDTRRRAMVAKIKIAQKELDMDDDTYRAVLLRVTGKNSSTRLDAAELDAVLREMCRLGFVPRPAAYVRPPLHLADHGGLIRKIGALLAQTGKTWAYANGIARKMFGVETVQRCDAEQMRKVLAALNYQARREAQRAA